MEPWKNNSATYKVIFPQHFKNQLKDYLKKDPGLKTRLISALEVQTLEQFIPISGEVLKARVSGQNRGKSKGYRVYMFFSARNGILAPMTIFSKSDYADLPEKEIIGHLRAVKVELGLQL